MEDYEKTMMKEDFENGGLMGPDSHELPKQTKKHFSRIGFAYFFGTLIIFAVQYLTTWIVQRFFPQIMTGYDTVLIISSLSMYLLAIPFLAALVRRIPGTAIQEHKMGIGKWVAAFLMSYAVMYLSNLIGVVITQSISVIKGDAVRNLMGEVVSEISPLTAFVLMVICAPIVEEYTFRKLIADRTVKYGEKTAIVLSGLMFGLFHGNLNQFDYAFTLGMFFAFIYVKTGKLIYTITLHAAINFMGSIPGIFMLKSEAFAEFADMSGDIDEMMYLFASYAQEIMVYILYLIFVIVLVAAGVICWGLSFKKMKCVPGEVIIMKGQRFRTVILNGGMILYSLFWIWQIIKQLTE